ncbi:phenylalanine--tRNA ligase subunit alpha [Amedibacillus sp. YH-ame10]
MDVLTTLKEEGLSKIASCKDVNELQQLRVLYLGKKGPIQEVMKSMKDLSAQERPAFGQMVNDVKTLIGSAIEERKAILEVEEMNQRIENEKIDITLDGQKPTLGNMHPLMLIQQEMEDLFVGLGYTVEEGPEVEFDLYNFERANIPKDHPARDMQDTFYINAEELLRTHTTAIQTRQLEVFAKDEVLPIKVICPGKVYRRDDDDATHSHQFMQCEGLVVGEGIKLSDLKGTLLFLAQSMFGESRTIRFRPSYFQFTEPSVEVDVSCHICGGKGCNVCKGTGWIEILGAGMVHPNVLSMAGYDPEKVSGFAFGIGIERVAMLKYGISDIRNFYTNDIRFLKTFSRFE